MTNLLETAKQNLIGDMGSAILFWLLFVGLAYIIIKYKWGK